MDTKLASAGFIQVDQETTQIIQLNMLKKRALCRKAHRYYMYRYINCKQEYDRSIVQHIYFLYYGLHRASAQSENLQLSLQYIGVFLRVYSREHRSRKVTCHYFLCSFYPQSGLFLAPNIFAIHSPSLQVLKLKEM